MGGPSTAGRGTPRLCPWRTNRPPPPPSPTSSPALPATQVSLSRVGVTGVEKVIRVRDGDRENLFYAEMECFVDLNPEQAGVHMSRFEEIVGEAIDEVVLGEAFKAEVLAAHVAEKVRERQDGLRAEVSLTARYPETVATPESGHRRPRRSTSSSAPRSPPSAGTRTLTGVQAQGMTACPCAQGWSPGSPASGSPSEGFDDEQIDEIVELVPIATHNQRGIGTLHIGCPEGGPAGSTPAELLRIVESSMSSEIYELMKRPDEMSVVVKAHETPRFVEDCVREMIRQVVEGYPDLPDDAFVMARQENLETIHRHNVVAERYGTLASSAPSCRAASPARHLSMREWLERRGHLGLRVRAFAPVRSAAAPRSAGAGRRSSRRR